MSEGLPIPITPQTTNFNVISGFVETNKDATSDTKDTFFYGKYVSSGTIYALLYRSVSTARLTYGITITPPGNTATSVIISDSIFAKLYAANINCSLRTANTLAYVDGSDTITSANTPFTTSYAQIYLPGSTFATTQTYLAANTYYNFGNKWIADIVTSDWAMISSPGTGLVYSGANAIVEYEFYISYNGGGTQSKFTAIAIGSGTPTPGVTPPTLSQYSVRSPTGSAAAWSNGVLRGFSNINTNDSVILYTASSGTTSTSVITGHLLIRVVSYL